MYLTDCPVIRFYKTLANLIETQMLTYVESSDQLLRNLACYLSTSKHASNLRGRHLYTHLYTLFFYIYI